MYQTQIIGGAREGSKLGSCAFQREFLFVWFGFCLLGGDLHWVIYSLISFSVLVSFFVTLIQARSLWEGGI